MPGAIAAHGRQTARSTSCWSTTSRRGCSRTRSILSELGQNLVSARSGLEALEKLMQQEFAVVLLDVSMPDMDGFETARLIHEHPRFEKTPIIFVTGVHVSELDRLKGYKVGAVDYVSIPVVPEILRSKVAVLVELYLKRRELQELNRNLAAGQRAAGRRPTPRCRRRRPASWRRSTATCSAPTRSSSTPTARCRREITERTRVEQALKEADRHKDEFLAMLAHELRNPLAPIRNAVQLMRRTAVPDPQLRVVPGRHRAAARAPDAAGRRSARCLAHHARQDQPRHASRSTSRTLVARAVETVQPLIEERGHTFTVERARTSRCACSAIRLRLTQALGNVLSNAAKYTERRRTHRTAAAQIGTERRDPGARHRHRHSRRSAAA